MTGDEVINRAEAQNQERLFLIALAGNRPSQADPAQPAGFWQRWRRPVDKPVAVSVETGWTPPPYPDRWAHAVALAAHARRIRGRSTTLTEPMEER